MPVTIPDKDPTVATPVAVLLHVPPEEVSVSVEVSPVHNLGLPEISDGNGLTVNVDVVKQPWLSV